MQELNIFELCAVGGGIISARQNGIYIGPDGAPYKNGMPIYISIDQID
ncbi:hypothetical protein [Undibacterium danionis]|uniref:Uncharacterized protein n=1 Tax=Undibacterium danionis TaxID=1812100 RepID=A0ABV6I8N0_9BURK